MDAFNLRFPGTDVADLPLGIGVHGIGRKGEGPQGYGQLTDASEARVVFSVDRRGVWLTVADGTRGVHVNGRPIQHIAMLRIGDSVYVDGVEIMLVSSEPVPSIPPAVAAAPVHSMADPRVVLRGLGGRYHGRSVTLDQPRVVGSRADADLRIDDPGFAEHHARIEMHGETILLRDLASNDGSVVNGIIVRDAVLNPGDQVMFDAHHRFVVEAPARTLDKSAVVDVIEQDIPSAPATDASGRRLPWLLLAAVMLAAALSVLLLFGVPT